MRRGWGGAAAMAVAVLLGVTACTGDADPQPTGTVATTEPSPVESSQSPSPTVTVPPLPPEATTQDAAGAAAFVMHFFDLVNYGYESSDSGPLATVSLDVCQECEDFVQLIADLTSDGSHARGEVLTVSGVLGGVPDAQGSAPVDLTVQQIAYVLVSSEGVLSDVAQTPARPTTALVQWGGSAWSMVGLANA